MGLLATFSRTALVTSIVLIFVFSPIKFYMKIIAAAICVAFLMFSFDLRDLPIDSIESMDRYWMWYSGISLLKNHFAEALFGFPPGVSLPVEIPKSLEWLWNSQQEGWNVSGVLPFQYHSFWLRLMITWGLIMGSILISLCIAMMFSKRLPSYAKGLILDVLSRGSDNGSVLF